MLKITSIPRNIALCIKPAECFFCPQPEKPEPKKSEPQCAPDEIRDKAKKECVGKQPLCESNQYF